MYVPVLREEKLSVVHKEDVKAALCKRYGTLIKAARALRLKNTQLTDYIAGKSHTAHDVVARELGFDPAHFKMVSGIIPKSGAQSAAPSEHAA